MSRFAYATALLLELIGAAGALLIAARTWQTVTTPRPAPLPADVLSLTGRTVDAAPTALALVSLAGVVAVIATRGAARRVIGAVVTVAGAALVWRALTSSAAIGAERARSLVTARHRTVDVAAAQPRVVVHAAWPSLTVACGVLVLAAGLLTVARGHRWQALSARFDRPPDDGSDALAKPASPTAPAMWGALDRGQDPTSDAGEEAADAADPDAVTDQAYATIDAPRDPAQDQLATLDPGQTGSDSTGGRSGGQRAG